MMPKKKKITGEPHSTRTLEIAPAQYKKEDQIESIGMVLAKYPLNVKLELLTTLKC